MCNWLLSYDMSHVTQLTWKWWLLYKMMIFNSKYNYENQNKEIRYVVLSHRQMQWKKHFEKYHHINALSFYRSKMFWTGPKTTFRYRISHFETCPKHLVHTKQFGHVQNSFGPKEGQGILLTFYYTYCSIISTVWKKIPQFSVISTVQSP